MAANDRVRVAVLGATGYSGIEAVRLLAGHPFVELTVLTEAMDLELREPPHSWVLGSNSCSSARVATAIGP